MHRAARSKRNPPLADDVAPRRRFYYLVKTDPPTLEQFGSYRAQGKVPPGVRTPAQLEPYRRVSLWATEEQARECERRMRERFDQIAVLDIPGAVPVVQRGRHEGHHEVHENDAPPELLRSWVSGIIRVR